VTFVAAAAAVAFVVLGAARDRAVSVNDQRALGTPPRWRPLSSGA